MKMTRSYLSIATLSLLATHQVDASFQKEWELFGVPGGIDFFLVFNMFAMSTLLVSFMKLVSKSATNFFWTYVTPMTGILTVAIHSYFITKGHSEFTQRGSVLVLILLSVSSSAEVYLARK